MKKILILIVLLIVAEVASATTFVLSQSQQFIYDINYYFSLGIIKNGDLVIIENPVQLVGGTLNTNGITIIAYGKVEVLATIYINGSNNTLQGFTWDGNNGFLGTALNIKGTSNTIRSCEFLNFAHPVNETVIIKVGMPLGGNDTVIESNLFRMWGRRNVPKGGKNSSGCIQIGLVETVNSVKRVRIKGNKFTLGPGKVYGYNSAIQFYGSALVEFNLFDEGQECLEIKANDITIRNNIIRNYSGYNILANRGGKNNLFENNLVYDCMEAVDNESVTQGIMVWEGGNTVYRNNIIANCMKIGLINGRQTTAHNQLKHVLFANNTFVNNGNGIKFQNGFGAPDDIVFINNIFYANSSYAPIYGQDPSSIGYFSHNLFQGVTPDGLNPVIANPNFEDLANRNFKLTPNSPAIDAGMYWGTNMPYIDHGLEVDAQGNLYQKSVIRPVDGNYDGILKFDIGAYEFIDPSIPEVFCEVVPEIQLESGTIAGGYGISNTLIASNVTVVSGTSSTLTAAKSISMRTGFTAQTGSIFWAKLEEGGGCTHVI